MRHPHAPLLANQDMASRSMHSRGLVHCYKEMISPERTHSEWSHGLAVQHEVQREMFVGQGRIADLLL